MSVPLLSMPVFRRTVAAQVALETRAQVVHRLASDRREAVSSLKAHDDPFDAYKLTRQSRQALDAQIAEFDRILGLLEVCPLCCGECGTWKADALGSDGSFVTCGECDGYGCK